MPIYMQYGSLKGDVQEASHPNWIELSATSWGVNRTVSSPSGAAAGRVLSAPRVTELVVSKGQDVATIPLVQEALQGAPTAVEIDFVRTGSEQMEVFFTISLKDAIITGFSQSSASDRPVENLTLNFTQVSVRGSQMDQDGSAASPSSYGWNVAANAPA